MLWVSPKKPSLLSLLIQEVVPLHLHLKVWNCVTSPWYIIRVPVAIRGALPLSNLLDVLIDLTCTWVVRENLSFLEELHGTLQMQSNLTHETDRLGLFVSNSADELRKHVFYRHTYCHDLDLVMIANGSIWLKWLAHWWTACCKNVLDTAILDCILKQFAFTD
jgi:hypothetical protein